MLGFADAWMGAAQFRANEEQRANERAMAARRLAMQEQEFQTSQREAGLRLGALERLDRRRQDLVDAELNGPFDAGIPNPGQGPGVPPQMTPDMAAMLENNAPNEGMVALPPPPQPGQPRASGPRTNTRSRQAMRALMAEKLDVEGLRRMDAEEQAEALDESRRAYFQTLQATPPEKLAEMYNQLTGAAGLDTVAMWDPKARTLLERTATGTRAVPMGEMLNGLMAVWEAGKGNMAAGLQNMAAAAERRQQRSDQLYNRSVQLAGAQSGAFYANLRANNDADRLSLARAQAERRRQSEAEPIAFTEDRKGMIVWDPATKTTTTIPMPEGAAGAALLRKFQTRPQGPSPAELMKQAQELMALDEDLTYQGALEQAREMYATAAGQGGVPGADPIFEERDRMLREKMEAEARRKGSEGPAHQFRQMPSPQPPRTTPMGPATGALPPRW